MIHKKSQINQQRVITCCQDSCQVHANKSELINKNPMQFTRYINSMDLEKLNLSNEEL
jgi:hypothetical protein